MNTNSRIINKRYKATPAALHTIRKDVRDMLFELGLTPNQVDPLVLTVNEACTNIIEHGYGKENQGDIILDAFFHNNEIVFQLTDFAPSIDETYMNIKELGDHSPGGLGIHFMRQLMDSVEFSHPPGKNGNIVTMKKHIK